MTSAESKTSSNPQVQDHLREGSYHQRTRNFAKESLSTHRKSRMNILNGTPFGVDCPTRQESNTTFPLMEISVLQHLHLDSSQHQHERKEQRKLMTWNHGASVSNCVKNKDGLVN